MLTVLAQYISVSNDTTIITGTVAVAAHVDAVLAIVKAKITESKGLPVSHIAHGLPMGCDEADSCTEYSTYTGTFGELPCEHTRPRLSLVPRTLWAAVFQFPSLTLRLCSPCRFPLGDGVVAWVARSRPGLRDGRIRIRCDVRHRGHRTASHCGLTVGRH